MSGLTLITFGPARVLVFSQSTTIGAKVCKAKASFNVNCLNVFRSIFFYYFFIFIFLGRHCFLNKKVLVWQLQTVNASLTSQTCYLIRLDNSFVRLGRHTATLPVGGMLSLLWRVWQLQTVWQLQAVNALTSQIVLGVADGVWDQR